MNESAGATVTPEISIVVCTYNRAPILPQCLQSLVRQGVDPALFEVLVVDNNSSDNTREVVREYTRKYSNFKYLFQPEQGLSHARNLAIPRAAAGYIAYIDDDARVRDHWLTTALQVIREEQPHIFGGPAYPIFPGGKPPWYKDRYGVRCLREESGKLEKGFLIGTNIVFKKSLLREYGGFDPHLGMKGDQLAYGEETRLVFRAIEEGRHVYYSKEMIVDDLLPDYKKSLAFFMSQWYEAGKALTRIKNKHYPKAHKEKILQKIDIIFREFQTAFQESRGENSPWEYPENYIVEHLKDPFSELGKLMEFFFSHREPPVPEESSTPASKAPPKPDPLALVIETQAPGKIAWNLIAKYGLFKTLRKTINYYRHLRRKRKEETQ